MTKKQNNINLLDLEQTPLRLIYAAERLFAEKGYLQTSVRDITRESGVNLAAVNYHFGGKEELYREVFRRQMALLRQRRIVAIEKVIRRTGSPDDLERLLSSFAEAFLEPLKQQDRGPLFMKLMMREMVEPHLPAGTFVTEVIVPVKTVLIDALRKICPGLSEQHAHLCVHSTVGQLTHALHMQKIYHGTDQFEAPWMQLENIVEHIVRFTAVGIRSYLQDNRNNAGQLN